MPRTTAVTDLRTQKKSGCFFMLGLCGKKSISFVSLIFSASSRNIIIGKRIFANLMRPVHFPFNKFPSHEIHKYRFSFPPRDLRYFLILSFHLCLSYPIGLLPSARLNKVLYAFLSCIMRAASSS